MSAKTERKLRKKVKSLKRAVSVLMEDNARLRAVIEGPKLHWWERWFPWLAGEKKGAARLAVSVSRDIRERSKGAVCA